jgi:hypothetical protein
VAQFVSLMRTVPDPGLDSLDVLYLSPDGTGRVGLWGFVDASTKTVCTVRVSDGSGKVRSAEKRGTNVLAFDLSGVSDGAKIQAFAGSKPFTEPLPVSRRAANTLGAANKKILLSGDPQNVCHIGGRPVRVLPLSKGFGNYVNYPQMSEVRGLAVHITTGGKETLEGLHASFERGASTHFAIDRSGRVAQYIAASYQSQGHGEGNANWLGVEIVGKATGVKCEAMTDEQLMMLRYLWRWVYVYFPRPTWTLATPFTGTKRLGNAIEKHFQNMAREFADRGYSSPGASTINQCVASAGLSCHYWVASHAKPCPGAAIMGQLPQVLGWERVRIPGDEAFFL